jgi:hypothetical protein
LHPSLRKLTQRRNLRLQRKLRKAPAYIGTKTAWLFAPPTTKERPRFDQQP